MDRRIILPLIGGDPTYLERARKAIFARWPHLDEKTTAIWLRDIREPDADNWDKWFQGKNVEFHVKDKQFTNRVWSRVTEPEYVQIPRHYMQDKDKPVRPIVVGVFSAQENRVMVWGELSTERIRDFLKWQENRQCPSIHYKYCRWIRTHTEQKSKEDARDEWQHQRDEEVFWTWVNNPDFEERQERKRDRVIRKARERADAERELELKQLRESAERMCGPQPKVISEAAVKGVHACDDYAFLLAKAKKMKPTRKQFISAVVNCECTEFECEHAKQIVYD